MAKGGEAQVMDQLERYCLAPDGSLISKSAFYELQLAREEMAKERLRYLEAMAIYCEANAMIEDYHQSLSVGLKNSPQVYETLEHRLAVAEAAQRLRLPLISKDNEIHEEKIGTSAVATNNVFSSNVVNIDEPEVNGVPNRFLGITPTYLWQTQTYIRQASLSNDIAEYQMPLLHEIETRLKPKCDKLADAFINDIDSSAASSSAKLPERVKLIIEEIEREEIALRKDMYSAERKFGEYYNELEQILGVLIKLVKDLKLQHQHKYDELQKTWLCKRCETMSAKLRVLEHILLLETYTKESIPALHKIRKYLVEATEEASMSYNKALPFCYCLNYNP